MVSEEDAQKAIAEFNQYQMEGRALVVNEARPKPEGGRGFGGFRGADVDSSDFSDGRRREPRW